MVNQDRILFLFHDGQ